MNLRNTLTIVVATVALTLSAQTKTNKVTVVDGPENDTKKSSVVGLFGHDESGYYTLRREKRALLLEHLSNSMAVDKSVEVEELKVGKGTLEFTNAVQMGEQFYMIYRLHDNKTEECIVYAKALNPNTLMTTGELKELGREKFQSTRKLMRAMMFAAFDPFSVLKSENEAHIVLITNNQSAFEEDVEIKMHLDVFDASLNKEWDREADLGYKTDRFLVSNMFVDDNGDVCIVGLEYKDKITSKASRRSGPAAYTHQLIRFTEKGTKMMSMPIDVNGKFLTDIRIATALNGDIIVAGFYSEVGTFSIKGAFYMSIDPATESIKTQQFSEFGSDFILLNLTDREEKKAKKKEAKGEELEMNEFDMRDLILRADGGATLVAEQFIFYVTTSYTTDANGRTQTTYTYHYLYNDIIVISFDNTGSLQWKTKIPKRQHTINDGGMYTSYFMAVVGDKLYFIFNDNPKNLFLAADETPYNFSSKEQAVVLVEVDGTGKSTKELLFATERGDALVQPKIAKQTDEKEAIICSQRSKIFQYSKIIFK